MRFRWTNGWSHAVEFDCHRAKDMEREMVNALIDFRQSKPLRGEASRVVQRLELQVLAQPGRWTDPCSPEHGYLHIINLPGRLPDAKGPIVRGTDWVWIIGPGKWQGPKVFFYGVHAIAYANLFVGFVADIVDGLPRHRKVKAP